MADFKKTPKKFQRLKHKYRLVILNDDTFEEKVSLRLSQLNVFVILGFSSLLLVLFVTLLIAFTPLKEFIPGYANVNIRKQGVENFLKSDSIELAMAENKQYLDNIKNIIQGELQEYDNQVIIDSTSNYDGIKNEPIEEDSILRNKIETEEKYNLFNQVGSNRGNISSFIFLQPLKGTVTNRFNVKEQHFGIDIVAPKNEAIKATLNGTVIFAEWTVETGYVIQLQHDDNIVSIYKHNSVLHKKVGDHVKAGEVIAIVGNSGELTSGPHLHFELWYNGIAINPESYMAF